MPSDLAGGRVRRGLLSRLSAHRAGLAEHFDSPAQQREAASLGVWTFLVTEVLFFGALFAAYAVQRHLHPEVFMAASRRLSVPIGTANTAILITSSLTMALAVRGSALGRRRLTAILIGCTIVLGLVFLGLKLYEYHHKWQEHLIPGWRFRAEGAGGALGQMFFCFYFAMTGLHAAHMIVGIALLSGLLVPAYLGWFGAENHNFVEGLGLYWHFVDIVWIFLYPLLYLVGLHV